MKIKNRDILFFALGLIAFIGAYIAINWEESVKIVEAGFYETRDCEPEDFK